MKNLPRVEELESLFQEGKMVRLGMGSRRACYRIPDVDLCLKCYRSDDEIEEGLFGGNLELSPSVVREIKSARSDERRNTSCQEYRYWKKLREKLPEELFSVFPQTMECIFVPSRGWCAAEELVKNSDGSQPRHFAAEYKAVDGIEKSKLLSALDGMLAGFSAHSVRLYDPQNIIVQRFDDGSFRLRIVDFEPATRCFIPLDSIFPALIRRKTARRVGRWLREQLGVLPGKRESASMMKDPISVSFSVSDNYSQHLAVVLTSFLVNNPGSRFVFHVLHRNISQENQSRIRELEQTYRNCEIMFHPIDASVFEKFPVPKDLEHVTQEMYYRYILPDVLGEESRTIYSDVDVLCVGDVRALWDVDLKGNVLAAVSEGENGEFKKKLIGLTGDAPYFYSGLLVLDLDRMRAENSSRILMENTAKYAGRIAWPDQDVINITFRDRILQLDARWDGINVRYSPFRNDIAIWHFPGALLKPWCNIWKNTTWPIYLKYLLKSPYRDNAWRFVWGHVKGFFYFRYTKKGTTRYLVCGIRVWKK